MLDDTIVAIATAAGPGAIGIVRMSGPRAWEIADSLFRGPSRARLDPPLPARQEKQLLFGWVSDGHGQPVDECLLLAFPALRSFTTQPVAEFQCHGGAIVLRKVLQACLLCGARLAGAGEFTKRAYLGGRLDLTQAEAINDLVSAKTERGLSSALRQMEGGLAQAVDELRCRTLDLLAGIEASLDYPDEVGNAPLARLDQGLMELQERIDVLLATADAGRLAREGLQVVIVGNPNVGKSSLLNALLRENRAIVTDRPGTTRDWLEEGLELGGFPLRIVDTAGIHTNAGDRVEEIGISRSRERMARADLRLWVLDANLGDAAIDGAIAQELGASATLVVANKVDLLAYDADRIVAQIAAQVPWPVVPVSALERRGLDRLEAKILELCLGAHAGVPGLAINARHQASLEIAGRSLAAAQKSLVAGFPADCVGIDLEEAAVALAEISGKGLNEEILDRLFSRFCVGK